MTKPMFQSIIVKNDEETQPYQGPRTREFFIASNKGNITSKVIQCYKLVGKISGNSKGNRTPSKRLPKKTMNNINIEDKCTTVYNLPQMIADPEW